MKEISQETNFSEDNIQKNNIYLCGDTKIGYKISKK